MSDIPVIIGGGSFATAMGTQIGVNGRKVTQLVRRDEIARAINRERSNPEYLPGVVLPPSVSATTDPAVVADAQLLLWAVPAAAMEALAKELSQSGTLGQRHVILAKGLHDRTRTLDRMLLELVPDASIASLKGPTFALPLVRGAPSGMTVGTTSDEVRTILVGLLEGSAVRLDHHPSSEDVELMSALKNVYAVALGVITAYDDAENTCFTAVVRILREVRELVESLGYSPSVVDRYCGVGDVLMTALSDRSRNRTLGVMIGKGFGVPDDSSAVVEGRRTAQLASALVDPAAFPILDLTRAVLACEISPGEFNARFFEG